MALVLAATRAEAVVWTAFAVVVRRPAACGLTIHPCTDPVLYLRPRNAEVAYAVPIDGPIINGPANNPLQIGSVGVVDFDYTAGFSGGINLACNAMTSIYAEVMMLDCNCMIASQLRARCNAIRPCSHPFSTSAATDFLSASSTLDIDFDTLDVGIRHLIVGGRVFAINYNVGARYSRLEQRFGATFVDNGIENVATDIDFEGGGLRLGLEAERQSCQNRLRIYQIVRQLPGRTLCKATTSQGQSFDPTVVDTSWEAGRVLPCWTWNSVPAEELAPNRHIRLNAGYLVSAWFNTVTTDDFIRSVQQNDFINLGDTLTFDGLRAMAELRF